MEAERSARNLFKRDSAPLEPMKFTIIIEEGEDGYLLSEVVELSGCRSQAKSYEELIRRTRKAILVYLEAEKPQRLTRFVGIRQIDVEA